jgi:hypothetical protein
MAAIMPARPTLSVLRAAPAAGGVDQARHSPDDRSPPLPFLPAWRALPVGFQP